MAKYIHSNIWSWGRKDTIILADGQAFCQLSIQNDFPSVAYLTDVVVYKKARRCGLGNVLLRIAIQQAKEMGANTLCLYSVPDRWVVEWYKRNGFVEYDVYTDGTIGMALNLL